MLEDQNTPVFLGLSDVEWHAFGYGLKEGFRFWKRTPLAWNEVKKMTLLPDAEKPLSPEIISAILDKYHYYIIGFALPEDFALLVAGVYIGVTNMPTLLKIVASISGFSG
ncbi:MAG: hypothetical protein LUQ04_00415 [Methanoregula sp.]|nr:hypothetical protein [Methanoregula sp.]